MLYYHHSEKTNLYLTLFATLALGATHIAPLSAFLSEKQMEKSGAAFIRGISNETKKQLQTNPEAITHYISELSSAIGKGLETDESLIKKSVFKATNAIGKGISDTFKDGNAADEASRNFFNLLNKKFSPGGDASKAFDAMNATFNKTINESGVQVIKLFAAQAAITVLGGVGYWGAKVIIEHIGWKMQKPRVVIEHCAKGVIYNLKESILGKKETPKMIFTPELEKRLTNLTQETKALAAGIKNGNKDLTYDNILLYGKPGTGKTMFAKKLAHESGMDFAFVTGSSFFQEGAGVTAIDELFSWAQKSKNGLCLFIDEADSLLPDRQSMTQTSINYQIVNHFLNYLGERSNKFMVILTTNYPKTFDKAMQRRINEAIEMPLPGQVEKAKTLALYKNNILCDPQNHDQATIDQINAVLTDEKMESIAKITDKFCYSDLAGIINTINKKINVSGNSISTEIVDAIVQSACDKIESFVYNTEIDIAPQVV